MYACIDLGSNSFHLLIGEWIDGRIEIIERCSEKVQLGENVGATGLISPAAFERGMDCLRHFKILMDKYPLEQYWALGTNALRVTDNADDFIAAAAELGIQISTISGVQEALLIYAGVVTSLPRNDNHRLVIDIGGGSTEVIIGKGHERLLTSSLAIGTVAWRDRFFADQMTSDRDFLHEQLRKGLKAAKRVFRKTEVAVARAEWEEVYASSGTSKMLMLICQENGYGAGEVRRSALLELRDTIVDSIVQGSELAGMKEARRDLVLAGWCVMVALMKVYDIKAITYSPTALREGMLDFLAQNKRTMRVLRDSDLPDVSQAP